MGIVKGFPFEFFEPSCQNVIVKTQLTQNGWSLISTQICRKRHIHDAKLSDYQLYQKNKKKYSGTCRNHMAHVNSAKFLITPFLKYLLDGYFCINTFRLFKNDLFSRHNLKTANKSELNILKPEVYFQPSQTSTMELFLRSSGGVLKVFL